MEITRNQQKNLPRVIGNREPIGFRLLKLDGEVAGSIAGKTFSVLLVHLGTGAEVTSAGPVTIIDADERRISWTPAVADVATAGRYALYVQDDSTIPRLWPYDGAKFQLHVLAKNQAN